MAVPVTMKFGSGLFYLGDGGGTEVFTKICGFTGMSLEISKDTNDSSIPDCDNPDAAVWKQADVTSQGWKFSLEGYAALTAIPLVEAATLSSAPRNVKFYLNGAGTGGPTPSRLFAGTAHITHKLDGKLGERWKINVDVVGTGALTITSVAAPV